MTTTLSPSTTKPSPQEHLHNLLEELKRDCILEILDYQSGKARLIYTTTRIYARIKMICQGIEDLHHRENHPFTPTEWKTYQNFRHQSYLAICNIDESTHAALARLEVLVDTFTSAMGVNS